MKKKIFFFTALFIPIFSYGQSQIEQDFGKAVDFMEGGNILQDWFMQVFLNGYKDVLLQNWNAFTDVAVALGGCFALLYFSLKAYELMTGDKEFQILPLLRPFALLMLIINWGSFISIINVPTDYMAQTAAQDYYNSIQETKALRLTRASYQKQLAEVLFTESAENEIASETAKKSFFEDPIGVTKDAALDSMVKPILELKHRLSVSLQHMVTQLLELLALWILRIMVYLIFCLQIIYTAILVLLGPIAVAFSITPMFRDALKTWIARYISVQFYLVVAFLVLNVGNALQKIAMTAEIDRYKELITQQGVVVSLEKVMWMQGNGILSFGFVIVSFLVSAIAILSVPKVSTWIVSTSGTSGVFSGATRAAQMAATKGAALFK